MNAPLINQTPDLIHARTLSNADKRALILHLLYTAEEHDYLVSLEAIAYQYDRAFGCIIEPEDEVFQIAQKVITYKDKADELIKPLLKHWKFERVSVIAKLILRYAVWELLNHTSDPALIINEAIELAKGFGEADSYRFVHGILDALVKQDIAKRIV